MPASFMGGSAPAMAHQIADGYHLLTKNSLKGWTPTDLASLKQELEKIQRDVRAEVPAQDDAAANQTRNRKIGRLSSAIQLIAFQMTGRRP